MKKNKRTSVPGSPDALRLGGNQMVTVAVVVAIAILVNLIAARLPSNFTSFDLSSSGFFTLSEQSERLLKGLKDKVTLYLVAEKGDEDDTIVSLLDRYDAASSMVEVESIDPVLHPNFTAAYTDQSVSGNSVIVECGDRSKVVDNSSIYLVDYSDYLTTGQASTSFDGEGAITSAISYVTTDELPVIYTLEGHGEGAIPATVQNMISKDNYTLQPLSLLSMDDVPEDADCVIIMAPQLDLSQGELDMLLTYMNQGGACLIYADISAQEMPNMNSLLEAYGMRLQRGMIYERNSANYLTGNYFQYLLPNIQSHEITSSLLQGNQYVLSPASQGVSESSAHRSTVTVTPLLTTTDQSYLKTLDHDIATAEKEPGDIDGPFCVGMAASEETSGGTAHMVVYTSSVMLEDQVDLIVSQGNSNLFMNTLGWMCQYETSMSIHAKPVDAEILVVPGSSFNLLAVLIVLVIPLSALAVGCVVTAIRRKK